jgi:polar amino acid transport system substrate-binding protein
MIKSTNSVISGMVFCFVVIFSNSVFSADLKFNTQDFAPFSYAIDGVVSGPVVEIIAETCKEIEINCTYNLMMWTTAQRLVAIGDANGLFIVGRNKKREEWLYFSPPILDTEYGFFVSDSNPLEFKNIQDIKGYSVGVFGPSNTATSLQKIKDEIGDLSIQMRDDDETGFKLLSANRLDAVYSNRDVGFALISKLGLKNIRYAGKHRELKYYIAFSKEFTEKALVDRFNNKYLDLARRGVVQDILDKYHMKMADLE